MAQFIGIAILYRYIDTEKSAVNEKMMFKDLPIGERPQLEEQTSWFSIVLAILMGTGIALVLIKYKLWLVWKIWFFIAGVVTLTVALGAFVVPLFAFGLSFLLVLWRILRPNFIVQTLTELFVYGGLAAIFVPLFSLWSISVLLVLIALYDAYAVWKSKHMITLAQSQAKAKIFAGLLVPYSFKGVVQSAVKKPIVVEGKERVESKKGGKGRIAILGGGDIGFPLLFAGVILKEFGLWQSLVIPFFAAFGLGYLLWTAEKKKFYPAMPFIGAGCFLGFTVIKIMMVLFV
jgi:presenilin-like A22 family membrane protease